MTLRSVKSSSDHELSNEQQGIFSDGVSVCRCTSKRQPARTLTAWQQGSMPLFKKGSKPASGAACDPNSAAKSTVSDFVSSAIQMQCNTILVLDLCKLKRCWQAWNKLLTRLISRPIINLHAIVSRSHDLMCFPSPQRLVQRMIVGQAIADLMTWMSVRIGLCPSKLLPFEM